MQNIPENRDVLPSSQEQPVIYLYHMRQKGQQVDVAFLYW